MMRDRIIPASKRRRGSISVFVLLVIVLMAGIVLNRTRKTIALNRQCRLDGYRVQCELLADAGIRLASSAWTDSPQAWEYEWVLSHGSIHETKTGRVVISTTGDGACSVVATYPMEMDLPPRVTRTEEFVK